MTDNQERENFSFYVHKVFITAVSLCNDLVKILVDLGIFNRVIFKDCIVYLTKQTNICWFK